MRRFPFIFCLLSVLIGLRTLSAMATVDQQQENRSELACRVRPSLCGVQ